MTSRGRYSYWPMFRQLAQRGYAGVSASVSEPTEKVELRLSQSRAKALLLQSIAIRVLEAHGPTALQHGTSSPACFELSMYCPARWLALACCPFPGRFFYVILVPPAQLIKSTKKPIFLCDFSPWWIFIVETNCKKPKRPAPDQGD